MVPRDKPPRPLGAQKLATCAAAQQEWLVGDTIRSACERTRLRARWLAQERGGNEQTRQSQAVKHLPGDDTPSRRDTEAYSLPSMQ